MIVCFILAVIIILVYAVNNIKTPLSVSEIANKLSSYDPTIRNFTLGRNPNDNKTFLNAVIDENGQIKTQTNPYPVKSDGQYYIIKEHGDIEEYDDGFKITGMDLINFKCPNGYTGYTCKLQDLCDENDRPGTLKPLSYLQFNALQLYRNDNAIKKIDTRLFEAETQQPIYHPRLRIKCLGQLHDDNVNNNDNDESANDGNNQNNTNTNKYGHFELQACPENSLLDEHLQCRIYDVCQDSPDGYKHNYQINTATEMPLKPNEYYICQNKESKKMTCSINTIFSNITKGCISQSICVGRNEDTIRLNDDKSYIQCKNDIGLRIVCGNRGIITLDNGKLACNVQTCIPRTYTFQNQNLRYDYGQVRCNDRNEPITTICDQTKTQQIIKMEWATTEEYALERPVEILSNGKCIPIAPDDISIIYNGAIMLRWTKAMDEAHPYDIKNKRFICKKDFKFRWDYDRQISIPYFDEFQNDPEKSHTLLYSGSPCQEKLIEPFPFKFKITQYPKSTPGRKRIYIFITEPAHIEYDAQDNNKLIAMYLWPEKVANKDYRYTRMNYRANRLSIDLIRSDIVPLGFTDPLPPNSTGQLELLGYPEAPKNLSAQYNFNKSGDIGAPFMHQHKVLKTVSYYTLLNNRLDTLNPGVVYFAINMQLFNNDVNIQDNTEDRNVLQFIANDKTMSYSTYKYDLGYSTFKFESNGDDQATLTYSEIVFSFNPQLYSTIQF